MANNDMDRVVPLGRLSDYKVAEGDPDVRGWEVLASDGRKIGEVEELLVDTTAMKVRYLEVDVDEGLMADAGDRHVLIPIGYARLERERDSITVDGLTSTDLHAIPAYDSGTGLTREHETAVRTHFSRPSQTTSDNVDTSGMTAGGLGAGVAAGTAGGLDTGDGIDTAGLNNTPGFGTGMSATPLGGTGMSDTAAGLRNAGSDLGSTGGLSATGTAAGMTAGGSSTGLSGAGSAGSAGGMSAGGLGSTGSMSSTGSQDLGSTGSMSAAGSTGSLGGSSAGSEIPEATGLSDAAREMRGDASHRAGLSGSDYMHNSDEDFYSSDAFDDNRFYGARRGGIDETRGGTAEEAAERLRQDRENRDVSGTGNL
ncbi:PRC-barrel domain-containing protein [Longimicrobium terrae]|uniref:PRC-barrel domain-containing protein n=1 Tax=Longimicrobium terrae TaxID=1639882 RepID=A0A841GYW4_9BACT|nr:PRC-barrel domain-containing protein [Longimicrobium terrae]MBB4636539.1 hypothetical protein [Longimicrobium terrae]MBB6070937.1 hypothetical protein [Longimicrobium terrae]NNC28959.1 hypothetical protein [Longimicrobium terrae]